MYFWSPNTWDISCNEGVVTCRFATLGRQALLQSEELLKQQAKSVFERWQIERDELQMLCESMHERIGLKLLNQIDLGRQLARFDDDFSGGLEPFTTTLMLLGMLVKNGRRLTSGAGPTCGLLPCPPAYEGHYLQIRGLKFRKQFDDDSSGGLDRRQFVRLYKELLQDALRREMPSRRFARGDEVLAPYLGEASASGRKYHALVTSVVEVGAEEYVCGNGLDDTLCTRVPAELVEMKAKLDGRAPDEIEIENETIEAAPHRQDTADAFNSSPIGRQVTENAYGPAFDPNSLLPMAGDLRQGLVAMPPGEAGDAGQWPQAFACGGVAAPMMQAEPRKPEGAKDIPEDWRAKTTVMLRNLPNKYNQQMLLEDLKTSGFLGTFDFLYLPIDPETNANRGYCFINFTDPSFAWMLKCTYEGRKMGRFNSDKVVSVAPAALQGFEANYAHYSTARVNRGDPSTRPLFLRECASAAPQDQQRRRGGRRSQGSLIDIAARQQRKQAVDPGV
eukprot:s13_g21.t1